MSARFTLDGSPALERRLGEICDQVWSGVREIIPHRLLQALVLGGGYGRGQGGVLKEEWGDAPYNDLEFYLFLKGSLWVNEWHYGPTLHDFGECLSAAEIGPLPRQYPARSPNGHSFLPSHVAIEFKLYSLPKLERDDVSLFSYDLMAGHRLVFGTEALFKKHGHHLNASRIPLEEGTRLLFNRCSGLLLAKELLRNPILSPRQADFVGRNLAKAQLALGDVLLVAFGRYHWDCLERHRRLCELPASLGLQWFDEVRRHHAAGVEFKLHPCREFEPVPEFRNRLQELSGLALQIWLWHENRRLHNSFSSAREYAFSPSEKWPGQPSWRNLLLNLRTFGVKAAYDTLARRYPRERLLNSLALLLWEGDLTGDSAARKHVQRQLQTPASDWSELVATYKQLWPGYG
jgi:hypothetical protein